jgi:hypothetical protein
VKALVCDWALAVIYDGTDSWVASQA